MFRRALTVALLFVACATSPLFADFYIVDNGKGPTGKGTEKNPFNCGAGGFDIVKIMSTIPPKAVIHIGPGSYRPSNDIPVRPGWSVIGAGMGKTVIYVGGVSGTKGGHGENFVFRIDDDTAESIYISDLTADCTTTVANCETGAISLRCKSGTIERVEMINPKATIALGNEGFPMRVYNNTIHGWGRIAGCKVTIASASDHNPAYQGPIPGASTSQPRTLGNYLTAVTIFGQGAGDMAGEIINNSVTCTETQRSNTDNGISAYGAGRVHDLLLFNNVSFHAGVGITMDTWLKRNVSIIGNYFFDCSRYGMNIGGGPCDSFLIRDNVMTIRNEGFLFTGNTTNFNVSNNLVSAVAGSSPNSGLSVSPTYGPNSHYIFTGNQIAPNLAVKITPGVTDYAIENQTGAIGGGIPGNTSLSSPSTSLTKIVPVTSEKSVPAGGHLDLVTATLEGASTNDAIVLGLPPAPTPSVTFSAFVPAPGRVTIRVLNTADEPQSISPASYRISVVR
jgi:hypothetical protein